MENELAFADKDEFRNWLQANHATSTGIWVAFLKGKDASSITANEALEEALCFGWIDGQFNSIDAHKYLKRFTPRRKGSKWSERNRNIAGRLIDAGKMTEHGLRVITEAKNSGNWDTPKAVPITEEQIAMLVTALTGCEPALANFLKMPASVKRTYTALYLDAKKEETRLKRLEKIIGRLNENKRPM